MRDKHEREQRSAKPKTVSSVFAQQPFGFAEMIRERLGATEAQMARYIGVPHRTYRRRARTGYLNGAESLKVGMIDALLNHAERILGSEGEAREWLTSPILSLGDRRPVDLLDTIDGYERVRNKLVSIEYGTY